MCCKRSSEMCLWWFQAAAFCWSRPQEAAGRPGVLQQICRVPALQGQTQLPLCLPAAHARLQEEVGSSKTQNLSVTIWQTRTFFGDLHVKHIYLLIPWLQIVYKCVIRRTFGDGCWLFLHPQWGGGQHGEGEPAAETVHVSIWLAERPVRRSAEINEDNKKFPSC